MITITNVTKCFDNKKVLDGLSLSFPERGIVRIMGESGVGKTTLLSLIAGLETPDSGTVVCDGSISMVFQEDRLLPHLSALDNVSIVQPKAQESTDRDPSKILAHMGLENDLNTRADKLSGGMARRVAIARCLAKDADIYLMDEPIKGLDEDTAQTVIDTITQYTSGRLLVVVTHDINEFSCADMEINI